MQATIIEQPNESDDNARATAAVSSLPLRRIFRLGSLLSNGTIRFWTVSLDSTGHRQSSRVYYGASSQRS